MFENFDLSQVATVFDRDLAADETLKKLRRGLAAYALGRTAYSRGKNLYARVQARRQELENANKYIITVDNNDQAYTPLYGWIMANQSVGNDHAVKLRTPRGGDVLYDSDDDENGYSNVGDGVVELVAQTEYARNVEIGGYEATVDIVHGAVKTPPEGYTLTYIDKEPDRITVSVDSMDGREAVREFIEQLVVDYQAIVERAQRNPRLLVARFGRWNNSGNIRLRPLESVILHEGQIEPIVDDLESFLTAEKAYVRRSIPWHRGYLFHGPPGSGKTSLAMGLASHFRLNMYYIPLGDIDKDVSLMDLIGDVYERSILLFEDVDVFGAATKREKTTGSASMSALLNALDGATTPHGLITIMTTNNLEVLDKALIRPGRVDRIEELGNADQDQATRLFANFYPDAAVETCSRVGLACAGMAPAEILEVCKRHLDEAKVAADELCDTQSRKG